MGSVVAHGRGDTRAGGFLLLCLRCRLRLLLSLGFARRAGALEVALHVLRMRSDRSTSGIAAEAFGDLVDLQPVSDDSRLSGSAGKPEIRQKRVDLVDDRTERFEELQGVPGFCDVELVHVLKLR